MKNILKQSSVFNDRLETLKKKNNKKDFSWYPYGTMSNIHILETLLSNGFTNLIERNNDYPIAYIGCADGDLAFFLEYLGYSCEAIDHSPTNWNGMKGVRFLKELLKSSIMIHDINLDAMNCLPEKKYGLVIFLGILYHLKNPFGVLENLSHCSKEIIISTRIARYTKEDSSYHIRDKSFVYLLDADECNNDSTNYWIFTEFSLKKILRRTGWEIVSYKSFGDTKNSNPSESHRDERIFLHAQSKLFP